jgi:hypothetical protein
MSVRQFYVGQALVSYKSLINTLAKLTEEEVLACLELEAGTLRRPSVFNRLIARAARLRELDYQRQLKEKYQWHVPRPKSSAPRS